MTNQQHARLGAHIREQNYIAEPDLVSSLYLMDVLEKPLLIEGEAGVGKTEVAKCLAAVHGSQLIRLQCYEGLDAHHALYDWDYPRQLLAIQMAGQAALQTDNHALKQAIYSDEFLLKRPLFAAIAAKQPVVLLIDEIDRADEEFEALLLEVLSDFQVSIPELGTYTAVSKPRVILTSNGVRELSDALRRRCLYHYISYPDAAKELDIVRTRLPGIDEQLAVQLVTFVQNLRDEKLRKTPGVAETLDWASALLNMGAGDLEKSMDVVQATLTCLLKTREDSELLHARHGDLSSLMAAGPVG
jgi:MoxR-like ATPase